MTVLLNQTPNPMMTSILMRALTVERGGGGGGALYILSVVWSFHVRRPLSQQFGEVGYKTFLPSYQKKKKPK